MDHILSASFLNYSCWSSSFLFLYFLSLSAPPSPMRTQACVAQPSTEMSSLSPCRYK